MSVSPAVPSREVAVRELWKKGIIHWKLDKNQQEMYNLIRDTEKTFVVIGSSRQLGKSFAMCTIAIEHCLKKPNTIVKYVAPEVKMVKRIIAPLIREICSDCPAGLVPKYKVHDHIFQFKNGSEIQIAGTDNGNVESIRGTKSHLCIVDEAGFCHDLDYIVKTILIPTTTTTGGKIVLISTPPKNADHDFLRFVREAKVDGTYLQKTIYDNPRLTPDDIKRLADAVGGYESVDFQREYMAEMRTDTNYAVIPEFTKELQRDIVKEYERPPFFDTYEAMDIGGSDSTAVLFAYYDFRAGNLVIEDELVIKGNRVLSDTLASEIKRKEKIWEGLGGMKPVYMRVADHNNPILLNDFSQKHGLTFLLANKDDANAALNNMRLLLKNKKIIINPRCITLIHELENTIWNKARTKYTRSGGSHGDALDALKYLCRAVNFNKNPYPENYNMNFSDMFFKEAPKPTQLDSQLKQIFTFKPRANFRKRF